MSAEQKTDGLTGRPVKLHGGAWGAHVNTDRVKAGDGVHLTTKSGKEWDAVVDRVVWTGKNSDGNPCALTTLVDKSAGTTQAPATAAASSGSDF